MERVQCRAAYWIAGCTWNEVTHQWSKTYDQCLSELALPILAQRHHFLLSLQIVHCLDCIKFRTTFPFVKTSTLVLDLTTHCIFLATCVSRVNPYRYSFFVNAPFIIWNALPGSILCVLILANHVSCLLVCCFFM